MASRFVWQGLSELRAALRALPTELATNAADVVEGAADDAAARIVAAYPEKSGELRKGVQVIKARGQFSTGAIVRNRSPHAHLFEAGTATRHTALGYNRGAMPPGRVFVPIVIRVRRQMERALMAVCKRAGDFEWRETR